MKPIALIFTISLFSAASSAYDPMPDPRLSDAYSREELEAPSARTEWRKSQAKDRAYRSDRLRDERYAEARRKADDTTEE
tara:strand:- start:4 stop:243 length:240 start_codon:yes stop_codon:yes gene_type:complete